MLPADKIIVSMLSYFHYSISKEATTPVALPLNSRWIRKEDGKKKKITRKSIRFANESVKSDKQLFICV